MDCLHQECFPRCNGSRAQRPPVKIPPLVPSVPLLQLGIPRSWQVVGETPQAPPTPQLKMPISTRVQPKRTSFSRVGLKTWVSLTATCRVLPTSSPAPNPAVGTLGKKFARLRAWLLWELRPKML